MCDMVVSLFIFLWQCMHSEGLQHCWVGFDGLELPNGLLSHSSCVGVWCSCRVACTCGGGCEGGGGVLVGVREEGVCWWV